MKLHPKHFKPKTSGPYNTRLALIVTSLVAVVGTVLLLKSHADSFCDIAPANNNAAISAAIESCADDSNIRFPINASYSLPDTIFVRDRNNLVIDGRGSTFTITTQANTKPSLPASFGQNGKNGGNWMLLRGKNITLKNMNSIGSFPLVGQPRSLGAESAEAGYAEWMSNYGVYGTDGAYLEDLTGKAPWGDTVATGPDTYVDNFNKSHGGKINYAQNVFIKRVHAEETSRMCFALTSGNNMWLEDSYCKSGWYGGSDEELDQITQPMIGLHILRNTFDSFNLFGFNVPVPGPNIRDIEVRNNIFLTSPDKPCNPTIVIGGYPDVNSDRFKNVIIENNTIVAYGTAIAVDHVEGGTVKNNKITTLSGGGCGNGPVAPPLTTLTNSSGVVTDNNGPNAPGADQTAQPPTPPPSSTTPTPSAPTPPPPITTSCSAPTSFAGTPDSPGSGRYDFTWSSRSGQFNLYYALPPSPPNNRYAGPFTTNAGSAFSLTAGQQYNFAVRAVCGTTESSNSNALLITAPLASGATGTTPAGIKGDANRDGKVNFDDAVLLIRHWNTSDSANDLDNNGIVNFDDAVLLIRNWKN